MATETVLHYKGYSMPARFSTEDNVFYGKVKNIIDLILCEGATEEELEEDFHAAIDHYLSDM